MITHIRTCCNGIKGEKFKNIFLKCISSWFGSTLVIDLKGLMCLNKETVTMTSSSQHLLGYLLKTGYNAEEPMSHHNVSHNEVKSITLAGIKMK